MTSASLALDRTNSTVTSWRNSISSGLEVTGAAYLRAPGQNDHVDSCRLARVTDADAIARIQAAAWQERFQLTWPPELLAALEEDSASHEWVRAILSPPDPRVRILVATNAVDEVVGFAALGPTGDPDMGDQTLEVVMWEVHPDARGAGHGSRLMSALADNAQALGCDSLTMWIGADEDARRIFATSCGWGPDRAHRNRESEDFPAAHRTEIRLVTLLGDSSDRSEEMVGESPAPAEDLS
jgi:L-amino acid N-acyltransferase YncA